jgi:uncharacterized RDD family membrane protein YckC
MPPLASLPRRLASLLYEALLLMALWFVAAFIVVGLLPEAPRGASKFLFQVYLASVAAAYCLWFWRRGGQTLAMKTWRIRLVDARGQGIGRRQALARFVYAGLGALCLGAGFLWALVDPERQFLHDRLAGTRLVDSAPLDVPQAGHGDHADHGQG